MEIVKYLCEFFFGNFWHFCGLWIVLEIVFSGAIVKVVKKHTFKWDELKESDKEMFKATLDAIRFAADRYHFDGTDHTSTDVELWLLDLIKKNRRHGLCI